MPNDTGPSDVGEAFDGDAESYDLTRRQLIPCLDAFYETAVAQIPFSAETPIRVLDLGAGTGLLSAFIARRFQRATFMLTDIADGMLAQARRRFASEARFTFGVLDHGSDPIPPGYDVVASALSIHHLDDARKQRLMGRVFDALAPGGVFINADQARGRSAASDRRLHADWLSAVRESGVSAAALERGLARMAHDQNAGLEDQLRWLEETGLVDVDVAFKQWFFVVLSGRKPEVAA